MKKLVFLVDSKKENQSSKLMKIFVVKNLLTLIKKLRKGTKK